MSAVHTVHSTGYTVRDAERVAAFLVEVLDFRVVSKNEAYGEAVEHLQGVFGARMLVMTLALGEERITLTEYMTPRGRPIPVDARSNDLWFQHIAIVVSDMEAAYRQLRKHGVQHVSTAPQTLPDWNPAAGGIKAFYFRDPEDHNLEVIYFPPGKGDPRWQNRSHTLFLGIDHTAVAVSSTARSLGFYREGLGLTVAGESENYGTEQEHLNQVFGARLRISGLKARAGFGIEFLEYLAPRTGRTAPVDAQSHDLWHWQTTLLTNDLEGVYRRLRAIEVPLISSGIVALPDDDLGYRRAFIVRDPDGHAMCIAEGS